MICPNCGSEYREGFTQCADCDVPLVEPGPEVEEGEPELELVKIFEGGNPAVLTLVESLLRDGEIEFMTRGQALQDLFAIGRFGTGVNNVIGPVEYWVRREDEEDARAILATLEEAIDEPIDESAE